MDRSTWILATLLLALILLSNFGINTGTTAVDTESKLIDSDVEQTIPETIPEEVLETTASPALEE